jgi:D-alanine-D-alanine ligase
MTRTRCTSHGPCRPGHWRRQRRARSLPAWRQGRGRRTRKLGVQFSVVDGPRRLLEQVAAGHYDRVFNLLHGRGGEDGTLQGALRIYGIPVTGSGVLASALTMDKLQTKRIWQACGLPTPAWRGLFRGPGRSHPGRAAAALFVKPAREGSSIGMSRVNKVRRTGPGDRPGARA